MVFFEKTLIRKRVHVVQNNNITLKGNLDCFLAAHVHYTPSRRAG
jgi:hypothetical protein